MIKPERRVLRWLDRCLKDRRKPYRAYRRALAQLTQAEIAKPARLRAHAMWRKHKVTEAKGAAR